MSNERIAPRGDREIRFDIRQTNIAKGVALLMLMWHHLFYNSAEYYQRFTTMRLYKGIPVECTISNYCKVCVAVFLLLSGYGLYMSWQSFQTKMIKSKGKFTVWHQILFVKDHLLKLMFSFWFIYLLFVPLSIFFGSPFWEIYKGRILYGLIDFLGLANLFKTPSMNGTWWFMSVIILFYLLFPVMMFIMKHSPGALVSIAVFLTFSPVIYTLLMRMTWFSRLIWLSGAHTFFSRYYMWLIPFTLGMFFARYRLFDIIRSHHASVGKSLLTTGTFLAACIAVRLYLRHKVYFDGVFAAAVILFAFLVLSRIPYLNTVLEHLGRQSGAIFMFHTFIFSRYFRSFIYSFKYAILIFLVLTVISYLTAVGLQYLKKWIRYDKLAKMLTSGCIKAAGVQNEKRASRFIE